MSQPGEEKVKVIVEYWIPRSSLHDFLAPYPPQKGGATQQTSNGQGHMVAANGPQSPTKRRHRNRRKGAQASRQSEQSEQHQPRNPDELSSSPPADQSAAATDQQQQQQGPLQNGGLQPSPTNPPLPLPNSWARSWILLVRRCLSPGKKRSSSLATLSLGVSPTSKVG